MRTAYIAHTHACMFLLDEEGVCLRVVPLGPAANDASMWERARRCVGARYVASLALGEEADLVERPQPGAPMLFACVEPDGRVALVKTAPLVEFIDRTDDSADPLEVTLDAPVLSGGMRPLMHTPARVFDDIMLPPRPRPLDLPRGILPRGAASS